MGELSLLHAEKIHLFSATRKQAKSKNSEIQTNSQNSSRHTTVFQFVVETQEHHSDLFLHFFVLIMFQVDLKHSITFSKMERFEETLDINDKKKDIQITGTKITMPTRP